MDFLADGKRTIKADERYEYFYDKIQEKIDMDIAKIFYLCTLLGFLNGEKSENFRAGRKEFRVAYLSEDQRAVLYTIANDLTKGELLKHFGEQELINNIIKQYQLYSNGGMEIIIEKVFRPHMIGDQINENYTDYDIDLMKYLYGQLISIPF